MYNTILVAIDGSKVSEKAFDAAAEQARAWKSDLHAVYVVETGLFTDIPADEKLEMMYSLLEQEGKTALDRIKEIASTKNMPLTVTLNRDMQVPSLSRQRRKSKRT